MRQKELQCVMTFKTTTQAMAFEEIAKEAKLKGRLIPLPRVIAAGCGLAWREDPKCRDSIQMLINKHPIEYDQIYEIVI